MDLRYTIATIHVLTLALGFASCWMRAAALQRLKDQSGVNDVLKADNAWGIAAALWLITGLWRAFGGIEKGTAYYLDNTAFLVKMGLFLVIFILEMKPMITFIRWRILKGKGQAIDISVAPAFARTTYVQLFILIPIAAMATAMARGIFY